MRYSGDELPPIEIYGLAICAYDGSSEIYRFSCNHDWEVENDGTYDSVEAAQEGVPDQYRNAPIVWRPYTAMDLK